MVTGDDSKRIEENCTSENDLESFDVVIIGAGAAGIGLSLIHI